MDRAGGGWNGSGVQPALPTHQRTFLTTARNLSCFQCFKVHKPRMCRPRMCRPEEKVCLSNEVLIYSSESFLWPGRLQSQWQDWAPTPHLQPQCLL